MIPYIYLIVFMGMVLIALGFYLKEFAIAALGSMLFIIIGVYTAIYGVTAISNFLTVAFSVCTIAVGAYIFIKGGLETLE